MGWPQKKGDTPSFTAESYLDHIAQAVKQDSPLSAPIPLHPEVISSADWISTTNPEKALAFWHEQRLSLCRLAEEAAPTQARWFDSMPLELRGAQSRFCSVAFRQILNHFGLGGGRWVTQFIFGFPTVGSFSQEGVFPLSDKHHAPALSRPSGAPQLNDSGAALRLRVTGFLRSSGAMPWNRWPPFGLSNPSPFPTRVIPPFFSLGATNAAFRFAVVQGSKLRPCEDLRRNLTNVCAAILTPITLPTWVTYRRLLMPFIVHSETGLLLRATAIRCTNNLLLIRPTRT